MVHALLLALSCAVAVSFAEYADYSGVKMPQYGGAAEYDAGRDPPPSLPSDDYHGQSPDAPASLDYKYDEKPRVKTDKPVKDAEDFDLWRKTGRKQREIIRPTKSNENVRQKYHDDDEDDEVPNFMTNRRYPKHRSRLKTEIDQVEEEAPLRRSHKFNRDRKDDASDLDRKEYLHLDKVYIPEDKNKEFDEEVSTKRSIRRRPREKDLLNRQNDVDEYIDENWADVGAKGDRALDKEIGRVREEIRRPRPEPTRTREYDRERERERDRVRGRVRIPTREREREVEYRKQTLADDEDEATDVDIKIIPGKFKAKAYDEYDDYYDMKRVQNIKNKLPSLLTRRTTVRMVIPTRTKARTISIMNVDLEELITSDWRRVETEATSDIDFEVKETPTRSSLNNLDPPKMTRTKPHISMVIPTRSKLPKVTRTMKPVESRTMMTIPDTTTTMTTTKTSLRKMQQSFVPFQVTKTSTETTEVINSPFQDSAKDTNDEDKVVTGWGAVETTFNAPDNATTGPLKNEINLKNVILSKAERKEGLRDKTTKKPPVLLQVTKHIPTVVMVEPVSSSNSLLRNGQKYLDDTPERIMQVKRLMRRKLVANAKSIHDLTDNWDDMVCDYIDTALLNASVSLKPTLTVLLATIIIYVCRQVNQNSM